MIFFHLYLCIGTHPKAAARAIPLKFLYIYILNWILGNNFQLHPRKELEHMDYPATVHPRYFYKTEFQSHELEVLLLTSQ